MNPRILKTQAGSLALALLAATVSVGSFGCEQNIPIDNADENPAAPRALGIMRGVVTYFGPPPCIRNGQIEGSIVLLLFAADNPPPPDGLASTALNFATVPGERVFYNYPRPTEGPGSTKLPNQSLCPAIDAPPIRASAEWSMQQLRAGRYQVRSFYSRQNRWNPLFNFANLALAGDVVGGSFVDPRAPLLRYAAIEVGVPLAPIAGCAALAGTPRDNDECKTNRNDVAAGKLVIPPLGFLREGIGVELLSPLRSNRPFFHLDYEKSVSFGVKQAEIEAAKDFRGTSTGPEDQAAYLSQRQPILGAENAALGMITFPQDHVSTSQTNPLCIGNKTPECDAFQFAQGSFPQIRFKYGFPGNVEKGDVSGKPDYNLAKNAKPSNPFFADRVRPYYGIDPWEFASGNGSDPGLANTGGFVLSRVFNAAGQPEILRDNETLESLAQIAELYPSVVLSKLVDDGEGNIAMPPRSQTDPIVVIQTITLRDWPGLDRGSMKASSQGAVVGGGLTNAANDPDPTHPLYSRTGVEPHAGFTALVRPSAVCIHAPSGDLRGTLVTPVRLDPNPSNEGAILVSREKILVLRANRVKDLQFGCLPPGYYSVNVVYPTGQAWSFPNLSGHCSYTAKFQPNEECATPSYAAGLNPNPLFDKRPLLQSQMLFQTDDTGALKLDPVTKKTLPQVVHIQPSPRCGSMKIENEATCATDDECANKGAFTIWKQTPSNPQGICIANPEGLKRCDLNGDGKISKVPVWVNNPINEDVSLDKDGLISSFSGNGVLDKDEDSALNPGRLDLKVPNVCSLPFTKFVSIPADKLTK